MALWLPGLMSGDSKEAEGAVWYADALVSVFLVIFAGLMSGLTLGLMSLDVVDLEVLERSGTQLEQRRAAAIKPVLQKQHQLLVTLLLCNSASMEALPIFLDNMFNPVVAVILSVTFVLAFGEVLPQAVCSRYGLAVGANLIWLVKILMILCYPISFPVGKLLDHLLGHNDSALFRRNQLKALVSIHGQEAGKGGELTHDETTIISGALDLTEKTAEEAMTPIESTFSLDVNSRLDWEAMGKILARGHSRVPVYEGSPRNIIGLLLVKGLLTVRVEAETPISAVSIRPIPRVPGDMPLYDILDQFQKGGSHMAAVVRSKNKRQHKRSPLAEVLFPHVADDKHNHHKHRRDQEQKDLENGLGQKDEQVRVNDKVHNWNESGTKGDQVAENGSHHEGLEPQTDTSAVDAEEGEVIGIITLEDVIEELLQEEIVDETDEFVDVAKRIRVAAVAKSMSRGSSSAKFDVGKPHAISGGGNIRYRKEGNKRTPNADSPRLEQGAAAAALGPQGDLRQPLLEVSVEVEQV
ncbi:hypothetical protein R1sor_010851 [Riccia sorocarpa]|uniref:CNNM transmembrane domain-containing protein n=1 Tax=Riccia sorocarpa TaxID=122646 RepID=A0ABD3I2U8_9MARC